MAKIKFGMMMTDARGKLGGQVFSKNRAGAYVRTKVTPSNARTVAQQASRSILGNLSTAWNGLDAAAVKAWNAAVDEWKKTDVFGDLKTPSGKNLFIELNKNLLQSNQSQLTLPPEKDDVSDYTGTSVEVNTTAKTITFGSFTTIPDNTVMQVWATAPISNGISYVKNRLRVIAYLPKGAISGSVAYDAYEAKFGNITANDRIAFQMKMITKTGQTSVPVIQFAVAKAGE